MKDIAAVEGILRTGRGFPERKADKAVMAKMQSREPGIGIIIT